MSAHPRIAVGTPYLTVEEIKAAARAAYDERRLTAQHGGRCTYEDEHGHVCALGAAMPEGVLVQIEHLCLNGAAITRVLDGGLIAVESLTAAVRIQDAYDDWVAFPKYERRRDAFLAAIDHPSVARPDPLAPILAAMARAKQRALAQKLTYAARKLIRDAAWRDRQAARLGLDIDVADPADLVRLLSAELRDPRRSDIDRLHLVPALLAARWLRRHALRDAEGAVVAVRSSRLTTLFLHEVA